jgi:hypothetical protein
LTLDLQRDIITGMKLILVAAALCSLAPAAYGQVILLSDDFDRGTPLAPVALDGTSPTYAASPESWTADSSITTNGSSAFVPGTSTIAPDYGNTGYIGIPGVTGGNLTIGQTYTLQFTMTQALGGSAWTAAGFGTESTTQDDPIGNSGFFCIDNGSGIAIYYDTTPGVNNNIYYTGDNPGTNVVDLTITMWQRQTL